MDMDGSKRIFQRLGPHSQGGDNNSNKQQKVCFHWRAGRCNRFPCPFLHRELPAPPHQQQQQQHNGMPSSSSKRPHAFSSDYDNRGSAGGGGMRRNPNFNNTWGRTAAGGGAVVRKMEKVCNYWVKGNCTYGNTCRFLHSWTTGDCFTLLTQLEGHQKVVAGIALPSGSDKLYSGSTDKTVRVWDCQSGQENCLRLLAGTEDGILAWKYNGSTNCFEPAAQLKEHTHHVVSLVVGANRLYSGSMDNSIRVWNLETMQCLQILTGHTSVVMSVLCWDQFLLSCSLDQTIKVWAANESGNLEATYTHQEEKGVLALCGMHDSEAKPVLLCSCNDKTIRVYDLPSFSERGKIFSKEVVRRIEIGPGGLFFTGDESGQLRVWKWLTESSSTA
uniref:Zinc finger CCCH domain-containing protein 48-like n=1 Tax=Nicotiana tabacum TaxID=4097 RepID=A0A1S3ZXJ9_TOBAC|nr:PREDICTED: zinc finger CCCH domain-containing protein 48-like [Nicotiana tabacum]